MKRFVILTVPRTGSNMLCTLLNSHPDILCHHEIFNPDGIFYALDYRDGGIDLGTVAERDRDPLAVYRRIWTSRPGPEATGFKLNSYQCRPVLREVLADRGVRKIVLRRKNRVKEYVSWLISGKLNQWEVYSQQDLAASRPRVKVEIDGLLENVRWTNDYYDEVAGELQQSGQKFLEVTYENLFCDSERRKLLDFLNVRPLFHVLQIGSVKQNPCDMRKCVENYTQLAANLRGTEFEDQLRDCSI